MGKERQDLVQCQTYHHDMGMVWYGHSVGEENSSFFCLIRLH